MSEALTVSLDETTLGDLDRLVEKTERSRDWLVAKAIEDYVALNTRQIGQVEAGILAANRGDFATEAEVARVRGKFAAKV